ncbi:MAG: hypothetical protein VZR24_00125 [Butyrivibrio hungatei]|nr:hypothetical protein [Butyrivibrio hungatei]
MARTDVTEKIKHDWVKLYQYGCVQEPVCGMCCEEYIHGYGPEHFFYAKATIIGYREVNAETLEEDMNSRVRHWGLYFVSRESTKIVEPPILYETVEEIIDNNEKQGNNNACSLYYNHYYLHKGNLIGFFTTKKMAKQVAERLLDQRKMFVGQRLSVVNEMLQMGNASDEKELPFD